MYETPPRVLSALAGPVAITGPRRLEVPAETLKSVPRRPVRAPDAKSVLAKIALAQSQGVAQENRIRAQAQAAAAEAERARSVQLQAQRTQVFTSTFKGRADTRSPSPEVAARYASAIAQSAPPPSSSEASSSESAAAKQPDMPTMPTEAATPAATATASVAASAPVYFIAKAKESFMRLPRPARYAAGAVVALAVLRSLSGGGRGLSGFVDDIRAGDRVTIRTPHGQERTGRAVMRGPYGWVLNLGGRHGTPGVADDSNIVKVRRHKRKK